MNSDAWRKYDIWLNVAVFVTIISSLIFFVVLPMKERIMNNSDSFKKKKIDNAVDAERISKIPDMERIHNIILEKRSELDIVLDKSNELDLIKSLEALASETGNTISLQMEYLSPDDKIVKTATNSAVKKSNDKTEKIEVLDINRLVVHISLTGKYGQLFNFLNKLENMRYIVNVTALDLKKEATDSSKQDSKNFSNSSFVAGGNVTEESDKNEEDMLKSRIDAVVYLKN